MLGENHIVISSTFVVPKNIKLPHARKFVKLEIFVVFIGPTIVKYVPTDGPTVPVYNLEVMLVGIERLDPVKPPAFPAIFPETWLPVIEPVMDAAFPAIFPETWLPVIVPVIEAAFPAIFPVTWLPVIVPVIDAAFPAILPET